MLAMPPDKEGLQPDIDEKDQHLSALVAQKEEEVAKLSSELADLKSENEHKDFQSGRLEQQIRIEIARTAYIRKRLTETERKLEKESSELQRVSSEFRRVTATTAWRLVQRYWAWNMRLLPFGTLRRRAYDHVVGVAARLLGSRAGPRAAKHHAPEEGLSAKEQPEREGADEEKEIMLQCERPRPGESCAGVFPIRGWAIASSGIEKIEVLLDGQRIGEAAADQARPDVAASYSDFRGASNSGYFFNWDTTATGQGPHVVTICARAKTGAQRTISIPVSIYHRGYEFWMAMNEPSVQELKEMGNEAKRLTYRPVISLALPVHNAPLYALRAAIDSVCKQVYDHWELCVVDDGSNDLKLTRLLNDYAVRDARVKVTELPVGQSVAIASNEAISSATGEFIGFLDYHDELAPEALCHVAKLLQEHHNADLIYSDEDKLDSAGNRSDPFFKPEWSPDLLLSMNYIGDLLIVRRELIQAVGGFRSDFEGSENHDLILRTTEQTDRIYHIPRVLYHRGISQAPAASPQSETRDHIAARRAIADYLERNKISASVEPGTGMGLWRVRYEIVDNPKVTVIIPACRAELLRTCLESVFAKTKYENFDVMVVDNSNGADIQQLVAACPRPSAQFIYIDYRNRPFNFSAINNLAVRQTAAPLVVFLNDDTEVVNREWLTALVEHGQRPRVGVVGAKLLYPTGLIQHAGMVMGIYESAGHVFRHFPGKAGHYFGLAQTVRNCSAVTAACMLTKRELFLKLGGFDENELALAFQDPDYCLRVCQAGFLVVYTAYSVLVHHESATRGLALNPAEMRYVQEKWRDVIAHDPYYSPNLTRKAEDYGLRLE